jgi:hypothetical protein
MSAHLTTAEGIATVVIALYVASVGTVQWITAREKLRLDLYDRRFDIYVRAVDFMQALMLWAEVAEGERLQKRITFIRAVRESRFLFASDPAILSLLEELNVRSFKVTGFVEVLSHWAQTFPEQYVDAYYEKQENLEWIMASTGRLETLLEPYLAFRHRELRRWKWRKRFRQTRRD